MLNDVLDAAVALRLQFPHTPVIEGIDDTLSWEPLQRAAAILYFVAIRQRKGKIYDRIMIQQISELGGFIANGC